MEGVRNVPLKVNISTKAMFYKKEPILERQQILRTTKNVNIGSLEKCASNYIFAKLKKTYLYIEYTAVSAEMKTIASKTPTTFIYFLPKL